MSTKIVFVDDDTIQHRLFVIVAAILTFCFLGWTVYLIVQGSYSTSGPMAIPIGFVGFVSFLGTLFYLLISVKKVIIDCEKEVVIIRAASIVHLHQEIEFSRIKKINVYEKKEYMTDYGEYWQKSLEIIGMDEKPLFYADVSRIFNLPQVKEYCSNKVEVNDILEENRD